MKHENILLLMNNICFIINKLKEFMDVFDIRLIDYILKI